MNINLITLNTRGRVDFEFDTVMDGYKHDEIKRIDRVHCKGYIIDNGTLEYEISLHITGHLTLKSAINASDVPFDLNIKYDDFINNLVEIYKNSSNSLDILPIIWENILLEIPIRAVNDDDSFESKKGNGWEILDTE